MVLSHPPGGLLCLDLASTVGVAYGHPADRLPVFWSFDLLRTEGEGARYASFENELFDILAALKPAAVVLEAPLPLMAQTRAAICQQQYTLRGISLSECWRASVPVSEVEVDTVRIEILGTARFRKGQVKAEVVRYCRELGLDLSDHNAGDAVLIWLWRRVRSGARASARPGPLFRDREGLH